VSGGDTIAARDSEALFLPHIQTGPAVTRKLSGDRTALLKPPLSRRAFLTLICS